MPIYNNTPTANLEVRDVWVSDGTGVKHQVADVWVNNVTTNTPVYSAAVTVTLTNRGIGKKVMAAWSDISAATTDISLLSGGSFSGRFWLYANYGGYAHGVDSTSLANAILYVGSTAVSSADLFGSSTPASPVQAMAEGIYDLSAVSAFIRLARSNASQGNLTANEQVMLVPLAPLESALGRQVSVSELVSWFGRGWSGSKTVTI